jgi:hypothetical protein
MAILTPQTFSRSLNGVGPPARQRVRGHTAMANAVVRSVALPVMAPPSCPAAVLPETPRDSDVDSRSTPACPQGG